VNEKLGKQIWKTSVFGCWRDKCLEWYVHKIRK